MSPLLRAVCGLAALASAFARADQRVTLVMRMGEPAYGKEFDAASKKDPKFAAELKRDMDANPLTALGMGQPATMTLWIGKDRERLDLGPYSFITTHHPDRTVGLDRSAKTIQTVVTDPDRGLAANAPLTIRDVGRTRLIAGHKAHEFSVDAKGSDGKPVHMRVWTAPDVPTIPLGANPMFAEMSPGQRAALARLKGGVLRFEMTIDPGDGKPALFSEQIVAIQGGPIPAGTFDVPTDYTKV